MAKKEKKHLSIMIIEDEQDILLLYKDYLLSRGHNVVATSTTANEILSDYDRIRPDVAIIDYKLPNDKNGLDAALQILNKYPSAAILIVTAYETVTKEITKMPLLDNKRVEVLIKPLRLAQLENSIIDIANRK
ncbi:MAG: response regulator [Nitrososphaeraceae archaeon]|jgi:Response regulator containing CheY-like receiver, AAA-type ATPase, and DNA-binding domains|nr:response regulator [Nitrososphaeraceae archaeon]MDW0173964.1 response regulator [Nitrososphaeraceae archaeon]MDW0177711.1 response regulator [Nitrososphaeraceae archaeon]MDW0180504.1 response regulator [Nitrososphaeraceae archaeon]MDW0194309.1 response regulator [Nitrososphaeraceae archaeon]